MPYEELLPLAFAGFAAWGVFALPAGWLGDRWSRRGMMLIFFFGTGIACILAGFARTPFEIGAALTLIGVFSAIYHPVGYAILHGLDPKTIGRTLGVNGLWGNLGVAFAALITGVLTDVISWRAAFIVPGLACLIGGVLFWQTARAVRAAGGIKKHPAIAIARPMLVRIVVILFGMIVLGSLIFNATTVVMPKLFEQNMLHLPGGTSGIGILVCLVFTVAAFAQTFIGGLLDRHSIRSVLLPVVVVQIPFLALAGYAQNWLLVAAAIGMMFFIFGQNPIGEVIVARYIDDRIRARFNAVRFALSCGIGATAVPLVAWLYGIRQDFTLLFVVLAALSGAIALIALFFPAGRSLSDAVIVPAE
jgi:MFS family permease